jgi:hypothetical protein
LKTVPLLAGCWLLLTRFFDDVFADIQRPRPVPFMPLVVKKDSKLRVDGLGTLLYCPVPDSGMGGEKALLDMIWTLAVRVPVAVGENWTKKVQVLKPWPAATI